MRAERRVLLIYWLSRRRGQMHGHCDPAGIGFWQTVSYYWTCSVLSAPGGAALIVSCRASFSRRQQSRGVREWFPAFPFLPIPTSFNLIPIATPAKNLLLFPLFPHTNIPIPSHSHSRIPYINDFVKQLMEIVTAPSSIRHNTIILAT